MLYIENPILKLIYNADTIIHAVKQNKYKNGYQEFKPVSERAVWRRN